jgi:hypothetical protein
MRIICRRERPSAGAQLCALEEADGWRYQLFATNTPGKQSAFLEARHRAHARVEDYIRCGKNTGLDHLPSVILSSGLDHGSELLVSVVDGVGGDGCEGLYSARADEFRGFAVRRVALGGVAEDVGGSAFAEGAGEGVAQLLVVVLEAADALGGGFEPPQQGGVAGALPLGWDGGLCGGGPVAAATALDV